MYQQIFMINSKNRLEAKNRLVTFEVPSTKFTLSEGWNRANTES